MNYLRKILKIIRNLFMHHWVRFFSYPTHVIQDSLDYDSYWRQRRSGPEFYLGISQKLRLEKMLSIISEVKPVSVADVGGADGSFLFFLQKRATYINRTTCLDSSEFALRKAKDNGLSTVQINLANIVELEKIPHAELIYALEVLEHIPNSENLLREMVRKADKMVVFSFPNTGFITYRIRLLLGRSPMQWVMHPSEHLRYWTMSDVKWWLRALGYTNYKVYSHRGIPFLKNIFPNLFSADIFVCIKK